MIKIIKKNREYQYVQLDLNRNYTGQDFKIHSSGLMGRLNND